MTCIDNDKLNQIKQENKQFVRQQSQQMMMLTDIVNAYQKENEMLKQRINDNSSQHIKIKQSFDMQIICVIMLLIFIIYLFFNM